MRFVRDQLTNFPVIVQQCNSALHNPIFYSINNFINCSTVHNIMPLKWRHSATKILNRLFSEKNEAFSIDLLEIIAHVSRLSV